ncbi:uncharacterized protein LOC115764502 [Drosophila novamexicana]|uniref:uncharacterized protein LOC115764502 n=1 Tax=Drosophila novamexicana TaxID=47314 RepID=UPI0011E58CAC|nr:uncharacterized protein LOC115764502 [Drosophila novamexicana]
MPLLENIEAMTVNTPPAPTAEADDPHQEQPVRELTQTDHLNKRLLKSLLDSMQSAIEPQDESTETESGGSDFDD